MIYKTQIIGIYNINNRVWKDLMEYNTYTSKVALSSNVEKICKKGSQAIKNFDCALLDIRWISKVITKQLLL